MRHDVVGQAREHHALGAREIPEHQRLIVFGVEGVGVGEGVRRHLELMAVESPADAPAERELEARQRPHHDGVDVLGVELGIRRGWSCWTAAETDPCNRRRGGAVLERP